jgi:hypothetical protein
MPRLHGHIRAQGLREVHASLPPSGHNAPGFGDPLQRPLPGPVTQREDTATYRAPEDRHCVSRQGEAGLHLQWN